MSIRYILHKNQFGFQKNKSTELAVTSIVSKIQSALDTKSNVYAIFLDFAKAFDTVNHQILLYKLEHYGIRDNALKWFESYLSNRKQYTAVGNTLSDVNYVKCGVPQGSILGPILFLLYINDIVSSSDILDFFLFADDTTLLYSCREDKNSEQKLNFELSKVSKLAWIQ